MRNQFSARSILCLFGLSTIFFTACKKENSANTSSGSTTSSVIAVAATSTSSTSSTTTDTVYIVQPCPHGYSRDSVSASALPSNITTYLSTNYSGYTFAKAFSIKSSSGTVVGYVVVIYYNGKPVGLEFDASGNFVRVLEQRERGDLDGPGWHEGGRFDHRDGLQKDTVALSSLPSSITSYMSTNYSNDTLVKAYKNRDSSYVVISKDNGLYATLFNSSGSFVKRVSIPMPAPRVSVQPVAQTALPSGASSYLSSTYPNYVFEKAFSINSGTTVLGYVIFIEANNTKYAVEFDASGNFVAVKTVY